MSTVEMTKEQFEKLQYFKANDENFANPLAQLILSLYEDVGGGDDWGLYDGLDVDDQDEIIMYAYAWKNPNDIVVID